MLTVSVDPAAAYVSFGLHYVPHPGCAQPAVLARIITVIEGIEAVEAIDEFQCDTCDGPAASPRSTFPSLTAALGDPPPGNPITAEDMAAQIAEAITCGRAELAAQAGA